MLIKVLFYNINIKMLKMTILIKIIHFYQHLIHD